jgi:predicted nicotinamide N-methyase
VTLTESRSTSSRPCELIEEHLDLGARKVAILRPPSAEELIDEDAFADEEFLPYWAELWPSGLALAQAVAALDVRGLRVLELGCGLGLPSLAAAAGGADVLATDWAEEAIALVRRNAERNAITLRAERVRWDQPDRLEQAGPWDLVLGADLLYEARNAEQLESLLPRLGGELLLAEPGRPYAGDFLRRLGAEPAGERVFRIRLS